jgi:F-box-like
MTGINPSSFANIVYALKQNSAVCWNFELAPGLIAPQTLTPPSPTYISNATSSLRGAFSLLTILYVRTFFTCYLRFLIASKPEEILLKIFHFVVRSTHETLLGTIYRLRLTWVCRQWRNIAIDDILLWNTIWFRDRPPYERSLTFLERAGTAPLDLRINEKDEKWYRAHVHDNDPSSEDDHPYTPEMMGALMDRLLQKIDTIRTLVIVVDTWPPALVALAKLRDIGVVPARLERFELHRTSRPWLWIGPNFEPQEQRDPIAFCNGMTPPMLNYLCLNGVHLDWNPAQFSNLTVMDFRRLAMESNPSLHQFREILMACQNLNKLALDAAGPQWLVKDMAYTGELPPITLPNLTIFVLGDFSITYALYCLEIFRAPNVIDLTILNLLGTDYGVLLETLTSRFPEVRVLTVYSIELDDTVLNKRRLISWLKSMPNVSFLKVAQLKKHVLRAFLEDPRQWDGSVIDIFAPKTDAVPVCPKLEVLEYQCMPLELMLMFVEGRQKMDVPLKKVYVVGSWMQSMSEEDKKALSKVIPIYHFIPGMPSQEEVVIRKSWSKTTGIPLGYWY